MSIIGIKLTPVRIAGGNPQTIATDQRIANTNIRPKKGPKTTIVAIGRIERALGIGLMIHVLHGIMLVCDVVSHHGPFQVMLLSRIIICIGKQVVHCWRLILPFSLGFFR